MDGESLAEQEQDPEAVSSCKDCEVKLLAAEVMGGDLGAPVPGGPKNHISPYDM